MNAALQPKQQPTTGEILPRECRCLECGSVIADVLARLGSIRCHDCRY